MPADYDPTKAATFGAGGALCIATGSPAVLPAGCLAATPGTSTVGGTTFYTNGIQLAGVNGFPRGVVQNDYKTYQPRVGFAYDLFGNTKTVLRGGFGTFYERVQGNDIYGTDTNPPFAYQPSASAVFFTNPATSVTTGAFAATPAFPAGMGTLAYHYPNPGTAQYSLGIQQQIAPAVVAGRLHFRYDC